MDEQRATAEEPRRAALGDGKRDRVRGLMAKVGRFVTKETKRRDYAWSDMTTALVLCAFIIARKAIGAEQAREHMMATIRGATSDE